MRPLGQWIYAQVEQYRLGQQAQRAEDPAMAGPGDVKIPTPPTPGDEEGTLPTPVDEEPVLREYETGEVVGRILIPKLDVDAMVVYGTDLSLLARAPGLYPQGAVPGQKGNLAVAGHRTTYGAWFRHLDQMEEGDEVILIAEGTRYVYHTERVFIVVNNDWSVIDPTDYAAVTLTSCHPPGSHRERIILRGRLEEVGPEQDEPDGV